MLDFTLFEGNDPYLTRHQILDVETQRQEFTNLEMTFIELPKFNKEAGEVQSLLEKWVYFIKHAEDLEVVPAHVAEPALEAAYHTAEQFGWTPEDLEAYNYRGIRIQDQRGALDFAREEGREEERMDTARKMKADGLDPDLIAKYTGLSLAKIERL